MTLEQNDSLKKAYKELLSNTGIFAISNFSSKVLIFFLVPLYTSRLSTSEYGIYDITYAAIQLVFPILTVGISEAVMRFLMDDGYDASAVVAIGFRYTFISIFLFGIILEVIKYFHFFPLINRYILLVFLYYAVFCLDNLLMQIAKGYNQITMMALMGVISTLVMVFANIMCLIIFDFGLKGFYLANILAHGVPVILYGILLKPFRVSKIDSLHTLRKSMLLYSSPLVINSLGWWANNTSDRFIVSALCGMDQNGLLSVAYKIPSIIAIIGGIFIQAWQISAIKQRQQNMGNDFFSSLFVSFNSVLCISSSLLIVLVRPIARVFFANDFYYSWSLVPLLIVSSLLNENAGFVGAILAADLNSKAMAKSAFIGIVTNITLNILFAVVIGVQGITIATAISSFIIYSFREKGTSRSIRSKDYKYVLLSWLVLVVLSVITICSLNYMIAMMLLFCIIFIYRKPLIGICLNSKSLIVRLKYVKKTDSKNSKE